MRTLSQPSRYFVCLVAMAGFCTACGSANQAPNTITPVGVGVPAAGASGSSIAGGVAPTATSGVAVLPAAGTAAPPPAPVGAGGGSQSNAGAGAAAPTPTGTVPCAVSKALMTHCHKCHGANPLFGAPMPLVTLADLQKPAVADASQKVVQLALKRLNDTAKPMPPVGNTPISAQDKKLLNDWFAAGAASAPANEPSCNSMNPAADPLVHDAAYFKAGLTARPGETCYELQTHGAQTDGDKTPFPVKPGEFYEQFYFKVPWGPDEVMTRFGAKFDNLKVLHHWLLFTSSMAASRAGQHETTSGSTIGDTAQLIGGWAVGGDNVEFPPEVGLELSTSGILNAQWHFYNQGSANEPDSTKIQVCTVPKAMRKNIGSLTFLGTENFNGPFGMPPKETSKFSGTCMNGSQGPITIFGFTPHMHKLGIQMSAQVQRKNGMMETLFDKPFDFNSQITYILATPIVLQPGESITSTCTFNNTTNAGVPFGPSSDQEMCYNFSLSYPARTLENGVPSLIGATNTCW